MKDRFLIFFKEKKCFLEKKSQVLKSPEEWKFFKGVSPCILAKNCHFSHSRFLGNSLRKDRFLCIYILDREEKSSFKKCKKNRNFPKG